MNEGQTPTYNTYEVTGDIRVMTRDGKVALNVFGTYALLDPSLARLLAQDIYERSLDAEEGPRD